MKRVITVFIFTAFFFTSLMAGEFIVSGPLYNYDSTAGSADTPNSFAYLHGYRLGIPGQIAEHSSGQQLAPCVSPNKIFAFDGTSPAYYQTDVFSYWDVAPVAIAEGQVARVILEVSSTGNCYTGSDSYVSCATKLIGATEFLNKSMFFPDTALVLLPSPAIFDEKSDYITISWTGLDLDFIEGYNIYRDEDGTGNYNLAGYKAQSRGNVITFTDNDSSLLQMKSYTYKLSVRFIWGGGGALTPDYYETLVKSKKSPAARLLAPTKTITPTNTISLFSMTATQTAVDTFTATSTPTLTQTLTLTFSATSTLTFTSTQTCTSTLTITNTKTPKIVIVIVANTATVTPTVTPISIMAARVLEEKIIIFNNPVRDKKVKLAFLAKDNGPAVIMFYNINGELVKKFIVQAVKGVNNFERVFDEVSSGVYIVNINVDGRQLPDKKVAIIQ